MSATFTKTQHMQGLMRLLDPNEKARAKQQFAADNGREKFQRRLRHQINMHPDFTTLPPKGQRDEAALLAALRKLGAPVLCYVIASDDGPDFAPHVLDDGFHPLAETLEQAYCAFSHGTILSCIPGQLALFRSAFPHKHYIVHRPRGA